MHSYYSSLLIEPQHYVFAVGVCYWRVDLCLAAVHLQEMNNSSKISLFGVGSVHSQEPSNLTSVFTFINPEPKDIDSFSNAPTMSAGQDLLSAYATAFSKQIL